MNILPSINNRNIYIDPSYKEFYSDELFNRENYALNRDNQLLPFLRLRDRIESHGGSVHTADYLLNDGVQNGTINSYYSLGILDNFERVLHIEGLRLAAFVIMEPPVVAPYIYEALSRLTEVFEKVYLPNTSGNGYSLKGVDSSKLHQLYWPIILQDVLKPYWFNQDRLKRVVVINGSHNPHGRMHEQYSLRINAMAELAKMNIIDLYGAGWNRWWSRSAFWLPYWKNIYSLMSIYKGKCSSKFEVLANYEFSLCFENMQMNGYITEKIFDCLYAGTIPLYMGAPNILEFVPANVFIDCRKYTSWTDMWLDVSSMSQESIIEMRIAGSEFLRSESANKFYNSLDNIICN